MCVVQCVYIAHLPILQSHQEPLTARRSPNHLDVAYEGLHDPLPLLDTLE